MPPDAVIRRFQKALIRDCVRILGRPLTGTEELFITSRGGFIALEAIHDIVKGMERGVLERYLASDLPAGAMVSERALRPGHYLGTVIDGKWWRRYRKEGLFARGTGEWWIEGGNLCFRRFLTRKPIVIALDRLSSVETGTWHAGRWGGGRTFLKLTWERDGRRLTAGFILARTEEESRVLMELLRAEGGKAQLAKSK